MASNALFLTLCGLVLVVNAFEKACTKPNPLPQFSDAVYYQEAFAAGTADSLKQALASITAKGFIDLSYDCMWTVLTEADQDLKNSSNLHLMYTGESFPKSSISSLQREHIWPKSHGFPNEPDLPYCDPHHLRLCNGQVNNRRSDKDFQEGGAALCLLPYGASMSKCEVLSYDTSTTFEIPMDHRGDAARMAFYLETRYNPTSYGLQLVNASTFRQTTPHLGYLCTLYKWHFQDPVSAFERQRNTVTWYYQGNRNPFIDHPEYVERIWGKSC